MRATWQQTVTAMLGNERGDELALAYLQGRALEAGDRELRSTGAKTRRESEATRRKALLAALAAMMEQLVAAAELVKGE